MKKKLEMVFHFARGTIVTVLAATSDKCLAPRGPLNPMQPCVAKDFLQSRCSRKSLGRRREKEEVMWKPLKAARAVAGFTGMLTMTGHDCVVVAPSLSPRRPGERIKTDAELSRAAQTIT